MLSVLHFSIDGVDTVEDPVARVAHRCRNGGGGEPQQAEMGVLHPRGERRHTCVHVGAQAGTAAALGAPGHHARQEPTAARLARQG